MTTDLTTTYLGLTLRSPIVASAGPLTGDLDACRRLAELGAAALVLPSLFEEEIVHDEVQMHWAMEAGAGQFAEAADYFPDPGDVLTVCDRYLSRVESTKAAVGIPVIASLNATTPGGWTRYARLLSDAGADAIELNLYHVAADHSRSAAEVEEADLELIRTVVGSVSVPVAVKVSPYYSSFANFATRAVTAGAAGLVLFNRFFQPDFDLEELVPVPSVELSRPSELRLPLRWLAIVRPLVPSATSLAATSGIASGADVVKALLVGADVAMTTSALLRNGVDHIATLEAELLGWLTDHEYESVTQIRGSASYATSDRPEAFERANYLASLHSWTAPHASPDGTSSAPASPRHLPS